MEVIEELVEDAIKATDRSSAKSIDGMREVARYLNTDRGLRELESKILLLPICQRVQRIILGAWRRLGSCSKASKNCETKGHTINDKRTTRGGAGCYTQESKETEKLSSRRN